MDVRKNKLSSIRGETRNTVASQAANIKNRTCESRSSAIPLRTHQRLPLTTFQLLLTPPPVTSQKGTTTPPSLTNGVTTPLMSLGPVSTSSYTAVFAKLQSLATPTFSNLRRTSAPNMWRTPPSATLGAGATTQVGSTPKNDPDYGPPKRCPPPPPDSPTDYPALTPHTASPSFL